MADEKGRNEKVTPHVDLKKESHLRHPSEMSSKEKARFKRAKTGPKKISYQHKRKKKK